ncbi:hypothetical protein [Pigmentiphaga aceris]|uniref:hypothetical protein n=1 Tax=Pigmentiphaga aceris TaxID=1940612 RepID=UPI00165215F3|nr:hypothetical protein [Pigmentiphaga aceris]
MSDHINAELPRSAKRGMAQAGNNKARNDKAKQRSPHWQAKRKKANPEGLAFS